MNLLRCAVVALVALVSVQSGLALTEALTADQDAVLDAARAYALEYAKKLPDFMCTQVTHRSAFIDAMPLAGASSNPFHSTHAATNDAINTIEEKLTYFNGEEHYEVIAVDYKKTHGFRHADFQGAISSGEFGSALFELFNPRSLTTFKWDRKAELRGRRAYVFAYKVPRDAGTRIYDEPTNKEILVAYAGSVWVDAETKEVMRITARLDLPTNFRIVLAERSVDYKPTDIAGRRFNLPFHAELLMKAEGWSYSNEIDFKAYQKFGVESTIRFGNLADQPPGAETREERARAEAAPTLPASGGETQAKPAEKAVAVVEPPKNAASRGSEPIVEAPNQTQPPSAARAGSPPLPPPSSPPPPTLAAPGGNSPGSPFQLKLSVDLVMVPVVVRDAAGKAVGSLAQEDFELFDKGKRQKIASFTVETGTGGSAGTLGQRDAPVEGSTSTGANEHSVVYLFDDVNLKFGDLVPVRGAAARHIDKLPVGDRAAILSTSGLVRVPFTNDRAQLHAALQNLKAEALGGGVGSTCPDVSYFQADQMLHKYAPNAASNPPLQAAIAEVIACNSLPPQMQEVAERMAISEAKRVESVSENQTRGVLLTFKDVLHWLAGVPGTKAVVLISPGFVLTSSMRFDEGDVVNDAIRAQVTINALDARGLAVISPGGGADKAFIDAGTAAIKAGLMREEARVTSDVLVDFAEGTGGSVIRNTNDMDDGLNRLATRPQYIYLLGFNPADLKTDGSYHALNVKVRKGHGMSLQVRRGYYAASK